MARVYCTKCHRLENLCLCSALPELDNQVELAFLQHPLEQNQVKGTAWLTHASLSQSHFLVGEQFSSDELSNLIHNKHTFLLYPASEEESVTTYSAEQVREQFPLKDCRVLILDGTWKKTRKMLYLNPELAALPRIMLQPQQPSEYSIRKQKNAQTLSTLEAVMALLSELEQSKQYQGLQNVMDALVRQHQACVETGKGLEG
ncbi:DTW domain-containing protein [Hydrogenovibrio marinus]|nr:tRNA-uridine aminocarboxypropyltransferase [Hydrogenovibrio marinus]BBN60130.1 DTW domain-containing protein [Hydrogenovibrio marinus]